MSRTASRIISATVITAVSLGAVAPVANAASVTVDKNVCSFTLTETEKQLWVTPTFTTLKAREAGNLVATYKSEIERDTKGLAKIEQDYKDGKYDMPDPNLDNPNDPRDEKTKKEDAEKWKEAQHKRYQEERNEIEHAIKLREALIPAVQSCADQYVPSPTPLSTDEGELSEMGIGVVVGGVLALVLALGGAAFAMMQGMLG
ncbi:hypothetical protein HMPREF1219_02195 [Corynebacterium pyruviciproducens ATCC BAA-1742]|uniref:Uncharacterized protein n=1 Tax=Corynebacterium pyruviciproducens ATCC BAA-1742 TaxID=1125779 RepID=S2ZCV0_9CORY|nr:hypothetical protein [Corynebacterium pyruviciproducens]EPD67782.1 hypothetical protein HMPREF1219_02195 [Corynebacterium pyruviciproducens ATCC BAA-1742]